MKRTLKHFMLVALLMGMITTMTGCTFGRARIRVDVTPDPLVVARDDDEIEGCVTLALDGFGTFTLNEIRLDFLDHQGAPIENEKLPKGNVLPEEIGLGGTFGLVKKTVTLKQALGDEAVKVRPQWWYPGVPHPASCRITFLDPYGDVVGSGSVGLEWIP